jgi:hypothetical protein
MDHAVRTGGLVTLILHPFVSFVDDDRYAAVRAFLAGAMASSEVDVVSAGELAARFRSARANPGC